MPRGPLIVSDRCPRRLALAAVCAGFGLIAFLLISGKSEAQTYDCRSPDPAKWPPSSKPYFMVALDTSGSMNTAVAGAAPSCAGYPSTRLGHARCALANMVKAYAGEVNFGLGTFPVGMAKVTRGRVPRNSSAACRNGVKDGTETGVDCGGSCLPCTCYDGVMNGTETAVDCGGTCMPCTCNDGVMNGTETAVDCGGSCLSCSCSDGTQNNNETGVDCGGPCFACTCNNGVKDGNETGVDCGGSCMPCTCTDGLKNGNETGVDCGGSCVRCDPGLTCLGPADCASGVCTGNVCQALTCPNAITGAFAHCKIGNLWTGACTSTCGNNSDGNAACAATDQNGANQRSAEILVPLPADDYWDVPPTGQPNAAALLSWVDNQCGDCKELFSSGSTPLNGVLRDMFRYLSTQWEAPAPGTAANATPAGSPTFATPLSSVERSCRSVNVILITDGGETCPDDNTAAQGKAAAAAALLTGWTIGTTAWTAKTYVIDVGGATPAAGSTNIATGGGTAPAKAALNEVALSQALASVIAASVTAETCDNADNNCNGCIDEGSKLYCNRNKTARTLAYLNTAANPKTLANCCQWTTPAERTACNTAFSGSISAANPKGSQWFLPCWDPTAAGGMTNPEQQWLCSDPGEICDSLDNNCDQEVLTTATAPEALFSTNTVDESQNKCGSPAHCPVAEICDGDDNDCDGIKDNAAGSGVPFSICPNNCQTVAEICNGCDDDCDGIADNGLADVACGFSPPANCAGVRHCPAVAVSGPGACIPGVTKPGTSQYGACTSTPGTTDVTCDNLDDNCNGVVDEGAPPTACNNGLPGLAYKNVPPGSNLNSQCVLGQQACHTTACVGWIGPAAQEVCDGIDNDCNGLVDDNVVGVGAVCGSVQGICTKGTTKCIGGAVVCTGGTQPQPEVCDGADNNCNGQTDEVPLNDGPAPGANGCWQGTSGTCTFNNLSWNAPTGATCNGLGSLTAPCQAGALVCLGAQKWACQGGVGPTPEVCDGTDNDCDGLTDSADPSETGVGGVCAPPGTVLGSACQGTSSCLAGKVTCSGGASPTPEICDGKDNDCDGLVDAADPDLVGVGTTCGSSLGTCKTGILACVSGAPVCQGEVKPGIEICDGLDNDCNGAIDDSPTDTPASLGCWNVAGATCSGGGKTWSPPPGATCTGPGTLTSPCAAGTLVCSGSSKWVCQGGTLPSAEVCDGADNNCDGTPDNGNPGGGAQCGSSPNIGPCHKGTLNCVSGQLLCQGEAGPSTELCDGIDNDCDGTPDDNITVGVGAPCGSSQGVCKKGVTACVAGAVQCSGETKGGTETCNGLDDDCDGVVDNNLADAPTTPGCWENAGTGCTFKNVSWSAPPGATCSGVGSLTAPCAAGHLICAGATGWACKGSTVPGPESCNGLDDNCNGTVDEGNPQGGGSCGSSTGACKPGTYQCTAGAVTCVGGTPASPEICDGIDNNCDGQIDEPGNVIGLGQICGSNVGTCKAGVMVCDAVLHKPVCQGEIKSSPEICDGKDNDCNGAIDDSPTDTPSNPGCWQNPGTTCSFSTVKWDPPAGATCSGVGTLTTPCKAGALVCKSGAWECDGGRLPQSSEVCDNVDNDCNGTTDDGDPGGGAACGQSSVGVCKKGVIHCVGGQLLCEGEIPPTPEICDNKDNDCNGVTDDNAPGSGVPCTGQCATGVTACVGGTLLCQTTVQATPEVCNGLDDDCNGLVDDGILGDAPANPNCWNNPGTTCTFENVSWDPPPGGTCGALAPLTAPCQMGRLRCDGGKGWSCVGGKLPGAEICDGQDQNCDGVADDGDPGGGASCGTNIGTCTFGKQHCVNGQLTCDGQGKTPEVCNGKDDDCDGVIDNGLPLGNPCSPDYDKIAYPGDRTQGLCSKGKLECDPAGTGKFLCVGGQGPQPETCNGFDDDCDGKVDEAGPAPDGVDGSVDPADKSATPRHVSDACGSDVGECKKGHFVCTAGQFVCQDQKRPQPEICDCKDNNCDGNVDEAPAAGQTTAALCGAGTACVKDGTECSCAPKCKGGEFKCPTGFDCKSLPLSSDSTQTSSYCVTTSQCGDCASATQPDECAPAGSLDSHGKALPICECLASACHGPCASNQCGSGQACVQDGDFAGKCRPNTDCRFFPCAAGKACNAGACVDDPCDPNPCAATEVCKPNAAFDNHRCEPSCANQNCKATEKCADGICVRSGCATGCASGLLCLPAGGDGGGACGPSRCATTNGDPFCSDGAYCDPLIGSCGNDPCEGVKCPSGQACSAGECHRAVVTGAGGSSGAAGGGNAGTGGTGGAGGGAGAETGSGNATSAGGRTNGGGNAGAPEPPSNEAIGLATGGGGCRCDLGARDSSSSSALALGALALTVLTTRRRARKEGGAR